MSEQTTEALARRTMSTGKYRRLAYAALPEVDVLVYTITQPPEPEIGMNRTTVTTRVLTVGGDVHADLIIKTETGDEEETS